MSRGPGRVQKVITDLIASYPHGAWSITQLCKRIYPGARIEKKHRVAVTRALRKMVLPSTWGVRMSGRRGNEYCLYDKCDLDSTLRSDHPFWGDRLLVESFENWKARFPRIVEYAEKRVSDACRYRDGSPLEKIEIEIANLKYRLGEARMMVQMMGAVIDEAWFASIMDELAELEKRKTEIERTATITAAA